MCSPIRRMSILVYAVLILCSCSSERMSDHSSRNRRYEPHEAAAINGFGSITARCGSGFLAHNPHNGKHLLYLEGTHYEMGFQQGYLCPERVRAMVHDYCNEILFEMLGLPFGSDRVGPLWSFVRAWLIDLVLASDDAIPVWLREEMQGIAEGYRRAQSEGRTSGYVPVTYQDVLLLNQGMDVISSLTYHMLGAAGLACNQFACWGERTKSGGLFHGRDFQFYTAGVYQDASLIAIYKPLSPDGRPAGHPFVAVTAPGFVGQATALNNQGLGMGIDVVHSWAASGATPGVGGLLLIRIVMEQAATLGEAISIVREASRGCPWIFLISDGKEPSAVVLETIQSFPPEPWMAERLADAQRLGTRLIGMPYSCTFPEQGIMVREADFTTPEQLKEKGITLPGYHNNPKYPQDTTVLNLSFPDTIEDLPEMIAATNHYLLPEMRAFQWAPLISLVWRSYWPSTEWRYRTLVDLLVQRASHGKQLDWERAWRTINFLDPMTEEGSFFHGPDRSQQVGGHVALMDATDLVLRALFGHYDDPWVEIRLEHFL